MKYKHLNLNVIVSSSITFLKKTINSFDQSIYSYVDYAIHMIGYSTMSYDVIKLLINFYNAIDNQQDDMNI